MLFLQQSTRNVIYPENFENKIGFDKIKEEILSCCLSDLGRQKMAFVSFSIEPQLVKSNLFLTNELKTILQMAENFPADNYYNVKPYLEKIKTEGTFLDVTELVEIKKSLETIKSILVFIKKKEEEQYPYLKKLGKSVQMYPFVINAIDGILNKHGKIKDNASKELLEIRTSIHQKQNSVSKTINSILKKFQKSGVIDEEAGVSVRNGRLVLPVNASKKRLIEGYIHDESSTGKTSYIEPAEIVELNNEIRELEFREHREVLRILVELANTIRPYIEELKQAYEFMAEIDFARAKAKYALRIKGVLPKIFDEQLLNWMEARHPSLQEKLESTGKKIVPLSIQMNKEQKILLISGPNAGGKSVCLKTVGLLQYMLQCGILVPVSENSEFGFFKDIFMDMGDEQSIEDDLSTYSSNLLNMKTFMKHAGDKSLLLIDEFGTGTEPMMGGAIAEAILKTLNEQQAFGVITTHYTNLKHFAASADGITNAAMLYDHQKMEPAYQLQIGKPGSSFAFEIARKIGLPEDVLQFATDKIGADHVKFDKHLKDIQRDKNYWENKRQRIRKSEKKLEALIEQYEKELENTKTTRKEIVDKAKNQADQILSGANKAIEKTIREIKESGAEKEKTKKARERVEQFRDKVQNDNAFKDDIVERKEKKLRQSQQELKRKRPDLHKKPEPQKIQVKKEIRVGSRVKMKGQDTVGEVMDINGNSAMVGFGSMFTTLDIKMLELTDVKIKSPSGKTQNIAGKYDVSQRKMSFKPDIDVRGKRVEEVIGIITQFIDDAIMVGATELRILHGKGNGVLRQVIREYLYTIDEVKSAKDEHVEFGGAGITVVSL